MIPWILGVVTRIVGWIVINWFKARKYWHEGTKAKVEVQKIEKENWLNEEANELYKFIKDWMIEQSKISGTNHVYIYSSMFVKSNKEPIANEVYSLCLQKLDQDGLIHKDDHGYYFSKFQMSSFRKEER